MIRSTVASLASSLPSRIAAAIAIAIACCAPLKAREQPALKPGDTVESRLLAACQPIQGKVPQTWEPGKVYLLELWASWCAPCVQAIPHVNLWHTQYRDKGLRVIGVNVWDDLDKATALVKSRGEGMAYPVAFAPKGGEFDSKVVKAAGVDGIPTVLAIKDGKLLFVTSTGIPLGNSVVEDLLAGGDREEEAVAREIRKERRIRASESGHSEESASAGDEGGQAKRDFEKEVGRKMKSGDFAVAIQLIDTKIASSPDLDPEDHLDLQGMKIEVHVAAKDERKALEALEELIKSHPDSPAATMAPMIRATIKKRLEEGK